jgi:hypothetical protein
MVAAMRTTKNVVIAVLIIFMLITLAGMVCADIPVHAIPGQVVLSTTTSMDVLGTTTSSTAMSLQQGSHTLNDPPLENGGFPWEWWAGEDAPLITGYSVAPFVIKIYKGKPIPQGEIQYSAGYNEDLTSVSGNLLYQKTMSIDTANKSAGEENIVADRLVTFIGGDGSRMTTSENILLDGAGAQTVGANQVLCPFASATNPFFPPFCNIVASGSSADISTGSISTSAGVRFISASADVPVTETYHINVKGVAGSGGDILAKGTVSAYIKANLQEGTEQQVPRWFTTDPIGFIPVKSEDLSYSEISTASGSIHGFTKDIQYQSGIRLV